MEWWWNRGVERKAKPWGECWTFFNLDFLDQEWGKYLESALAKTERTLQISGKCIQFKQSCLRTPPSYFCLRKQSRKINAMRRVVFPKMYQKRAQRYLTKIWRSLLANWICYTAAKTTTSLWKRMEGELEQQGKYGHRLIVHGITRRGEIWRGGGGWNEEAVGGRGGAAPSCQLISEPGGMVWQYIYFSTLIKKGLLLTVIQIQGTAETRRCDAVAVRSQVITWNPALTLHTFYQPLPPPPYQLRPLFLMLRSLSPTLLILHVVHRGVPK